MFGEHRRILAVHYGVICNSSQILNQSLCTSILHTSEITQRPKLKTVLKRVKALLAECVLANKLTVVGSKLVKDLCTIVSCRCAAGSEEEER